MKALLMMGERDCMIERWFEQVRKEGVGVRIALQEQAKEGWDDWEQMVKGAGLYTSAGRELMLGV